MAISQRENLPRMNADERGFIEQKKDHARPSVFDPIPTIRGEPLDMAVKRLRFG
jgi:hypothetical protein